MEIIRYYQTKNPCYISGRKIKPKGIVVHSTGANNPYIKRYVGPDDGILGKNQYNNHWNKASANKCVHGWIGRVADGSVKVYQALPWDHRCWGVGSGKKGSYNASHIQFEICEDNLNNAEYYNEAFSFAKELCAFLCKEYGISPENIVGHYEAYKAGYASNHGDPRNWQKKHSDSMDKFRSEVAALINAESSPSGGVYVEHKGIPAQDAKPIQSAPNKPQMESVVFTMETVRNGSRGTQVKVLQWLLNDKGYPCGTADGIFGTKTLVAVKLYQEKNSLQVDGVAGKNTWAKLLA